MKNKNAIVFGANGFVGKWLIDNLLKHKYDVTIIVRHRVNFNIDKKIHIIVAKKLSEINLETKIYYDYFFYLAWNGVNTEQKNNLSCQLENINIALEVVDFCKKNNCKKIIGIGSVAQYAMNEEVIDVTKRGKFGDIYGAVKECVYNLLEILTCRENISFNWIVLASTFGPGREETNIITYTIVSLLKNEDSFYGSLEQMWEFVYIEDAVNAIRLVAERGVDRKMYGVGSGEFHILKEYIMHIAAIMKKENKIHIGKVKNYSSKSISSCINNYDLIKDTNYKNLYTFDEAIKKTIAYYTNYRKN